MPYVDISRDLVAPKGEGKRVRNLWGNVLAPEVPGHTYIGPNIDWFTLAKALYGTMGLLGQPDLVVPMEIKAFHGSPYKFNKFSNEAIGTGEGAQAFGYGHYMSEAPEVAKQYSLTGIKLGDTEITPKSMWYNPFKRMINQEQGWDENTLTKALEEAVDNWGKESRIGRESNKFLQKIKAGEKPLPSGNIYETTIHKGKQAGEYNYLDWYEHIPPSSDTWKRIQTAISQIEDPMKRRVIYIDLNKARNNTGGKLSGADVYATLKHYLYGDKDTSALLQKAGFSGIKYPTGTLTKGGKSEWSRKYNYVVFDPEDITIERTIE